MNKTRTPLAVVGVSALFPGSTDTGGFWRDILAGADRISDVPEGQWLIDDYYDPDPSAPDKTYAHRGGFLGEIDFDPMEWGTPPNLIEATDTAQLLSLIVAQRVLDDATRGQFREMDRSRTSVILGVTSAQELLLDMTSRLQRPIWLKSLREAGVPESKAQEVCDRISDHYVPWQEATFPGLLGNVIAGRIANRLDLGGTNCVTDAACASALSAVSMAAGELRSGSSDLVIVGGSDTMTDIFMYMCFSKTPALSKSGDCRPFDASADGTLLGEGIGMVALKRLEDAERDGDPIYAVLKGVGSSSDGRAKSVYAPSPEGQAMALRRAYADAGYAPSTVELLEAHGTGTKAGDAAEVGGLKQVFTDNPPASVALGSVKSQIGHTKAAAGAAGLFKIVMALHSKTLPPTIKVDRPNPALELEGSPLYINTEARPWVRGSDHPRRASVSALGFGGSNFHVTVEEYTGPSRAKRWRALPSELILVTAPDAATLVARIEALEARCVDGALSHLAEETQRGYQVEALRLAVVAQSVDQLRARLGVAKAKVQAGEARLEVPGQLHLGRGAREGDVAFLFPGQGSQYVGMGADLAMHYDRAVEAWGVAADSSCDGQLHNVVFPPPAFDDEGRRAQSARLRRTEWAQPAIGCASLATLNLLVDMGLRPDATAGHSFGEVTALYAAGAYDEATFLQIARRRGELMAEAAVNPGAMTAVSARAAQIRELLAAWDAPVVLANHNAPRQSVLSGRVEAIEEVERRLGAEGIRARRLPVATAFHSEIVSDSTAPFAAFLDGVEIHPTQCPVYANATAAPYAGTPESIRAGLSGQIASPVRFVEEIEALYEAGARTFIEIGPGAVLSGLVGAILEDRPHHMVGTDRKGREGTASWHDALGRLVALGFELDFAALWADQRPALAPSARPKMAVSLTGANYKKPYPPEGGSAALPKPVAEAPAPVAAAKPAVAAAKPAPVVEATKPVSVQAAPVQAAPSPQPTREPTPMSTLRPDDAWLAAFQETQRQTASAHAAYQQAMAQSHAAFLQLAETSLTGLTALIQGAQSEAQPSGTRGTASAVSRVYASPQPSPVFAPQPSPVIAPAPTPAPVVAAPMVVAPAPAPVVAPVAPARAPMVVSTPAAALTQGDLSGMLLEVVADKTGYPAEMLSLDMTLEGDLGIDSIKRVEILSALQERDSNLPDVDTNTLAQQKTLGAIVEILGGTPSTNGVASAPVLNGAVAPNGADLSGLLLEVVADKTGYPAEMLSMEMTLEGDLGIDSIKRVEILSALQERDSSLPDIDTNTLAQQKTLGAIVEVLGGATNGATNGATHGATNGVDLSGLLLEVVADKTGYPAEMLSMEMTLEGDLGIDSIKRVEILSALQERDSTLPDIDTNTLAQQKTLGAIVDTLGGATSVKEVAAPAARPFDRARVGLRESPAQRTAVPFTSPTFSSASPPIHRGLGRFTLRAVEAPARGIRRVGLLEGPVYIIDGALGVAAPLAARLREAGIEAEIGDTPVEGAQRVVDLRGIDPVEGVEGAIALNTAAFEAARASAGALSNAPGALVLLQDTGGRFAAADHRAWSAGIAGIARTADLEWTEAWAQVIDLEVAGRPAEALAEAICAELLSGGPEREVGLTADGRRWRLEDVARPAPQEGATLLSPEDTVIVSGGARGVTAACVIALAEASRASFVLLGRSQIEPEPAACVGIEDERALKRALLGAAGRPMSPRDLNRAVSKVLASREIRRTLARIEAVGGHARYVSVDVTDEAALRAALPASTTAIIHGAGVIADKRLEDKTAEQFARVFDTKIRGLQALLGAVRPERLKALVLFSSVSARCGNVGQADYACANEVLNKVAVSLAATHPSCRVRALGWGPWAGGMVTPALEAQFRARGVPLIPLGEGALMLVDELRAAPSDGVELVLGGAPKPSPLLPPDGAPELRFEARLDGSTAPYLADHQVGGAAVVPMVAALDLFARPVADLEVVRGIRVADLEAGEALTIAERGEALSLSVQDRLHYRARALEAAQHAPLRRPVGLAPWGEAPVYGGVLFHGPKLQVIEAIEGISDAGIEARLRGAVELGWPARHALDLPALDGLLQLALLWAERSLGGATLPMKIERATFGAPVEGPLRGVLIGEARSTRHGVATAWLLDAAGAVVACLEGIHVHLRP